mgnify:CR=1 FL=1
MGFLAPALLAGLTALSIPVLVHLIHRERKETVAFPSLMFLRKVPYRSVRRQKLRQCDVVEAFEESGNPKKHEQSALVRREGRIAGIVTAPAHGPGRVACILVTAGLVAFAVALAMPRPAATRLGKGVWSPSARPDPEAGEPRVDKRDDLVGRHRAVISLLAGAAPLVMVGGAVGVVCGVLAAVVVYRVLGAREPAHERRHREMVVRSLPQVVDLLAVTLASGASPSSALTAVADAVEGPIAAELRSAVHGLRLGRDPARVWRELSSRPGMAALGRAMARAVETGASVSDALHRLAEDLHASARLEGERKARTVGVRAAAPLGLCLLPAFVLLGVVPLVASTVSALLVP